MHWKGDNDCSESTHNTDPSLRKQSQIEIRVHHLQVSLPRDQPTIEADLCESGSERSNATKAAPLVTGANQPAASAMDMGFGVAARNSTAIDKALPFWRTFPSHLYLSPCILQAPRRNTTLSDLGAGLRSSYQGASSRASGTRFSSSRV